LQNVWIINKFAKFDRTCIYYVIYFAFLQSCKYVECETADAGRKKYFPAEFKVPENSRRSHFISIQSSAYWSSKSSCHTSSLASSSYISLIHVILEIFEAFEGKVEGDVTEDGTNMGEDTFFTNANTRGNCKS
jgi:hypothetical protein